MSEHSTFVNALVGAVVSVVVSFVPFSPVIGGAVAGYLEREDGLKVGALSGALASLPLLLALLGLAFFVPVMPGGFGIRGAIGLLVLVLVGFLFVALYVVGLSAVGGLVGVYLAEDRVGRRSAPREESAVEDDAVAR